MNGRENFAYTEIHSRVLNLSGAQRRLLAQRLGVGEQSVSERRPVRARPGFLRGSARRAARRVTQTDRPRIIETSSVRGCRTT